MCLFYLPLHEWLMLWPFSLGPFLSLILLVKSTLFLMALLTFHLHWELFPGTSPVTISMGSLNIITILSTTHTTLHSSRLPATQPTVPFQLLVCALPLSHLFGMRTRTLLLEDTAPLFPWWQDVAFTSFSCCSWWAPFQTLPGRAQRGSSCP